MQFVGAVGKRFHTELGAGIQRGELRRGDRQPAAIAAAMEISPALLEWSESAEVITTFGRPFDHRASRRA